MNGKEPLRLAPTADRAPPDYPPAALGCIMIVATAITVTLIIGALVTSTSPPPLEVGAAVAAAIPPSGGGAAPLRLHGAHILFRRPVGFDGDDACAALGAIERDRSIERVRARNGAWVEAEVTGSGPVWLLDPSIDRGRLTAATVAYRAPQDPAVCDIVAVVEDATYTLHPMTSSAPPRWRLIDVDGVQAWIYDF